MVLLMKKLLGKFSDILYRPVISDGELGMKVLVFTRCNVYILRADFKNR